MRKSIKKRRSVNQRGMSAWLATWEHFGEHARPPGRIAAVFNPRWSASRVQEHLELLYVRHAYTLSEQLRYANNRRFNPYPAQFANPHGIPFGDRLTCGHNPFLYARLVSNLRLVGKLEDEASLTWDERPLPKNMAAIRRRLGISAEA